MKKFWIVVVSLMVISFLTGFEVIGKTRWEYKVGFLMPEEKAKFYLNALQECKELGVESEEFRNFCRKFYPEGLTPEKQLEALKTFKELEMEKIKSKAMPSFAEQEEYLNSLQKRGWEVVAITTDKDTGFPVVYLRRRGKEKLDRKEEPVTPFEYPDR